MKAFVITLLAVLVAGAGRITVLVWFGVYNVAADDPHSRVVHDLLDVGRERSVVVRAVNLRCLTSPVPSCSGGAPVTTQRCARSVTASGG